MDNKTIGARQPPRLVSASDIAARLNLDKRRIVNKVKELELKRERYVKRWRDIRDYQLPYIGEFDGVDDEWNAAERKDINVYHGQAWEANQIFASGIMSGLTPPNRKWFRLNFANEELSDNSDLSNLLDMRMDVVNDVLEKSNFYNSVHSCYLELAFGQAALGIFPDTRYGVHFVPYTIGSYYLDNGPDGTVQVFAHKYRMSAQQLVDKFSVENVPFNIRQELENGPGLKARHKVIWYVEANHYADSTKLGGEYMPYLSCYYIEGSAEDEWLYVGGFYEWPVPVARYLVVGEEAYGKGPGWFAEGDSKALQLMEKDRLTMVELTVKPPMVVTSDMAGKGVNLVPGGKTFAQQPDSAKPAFQVGGNLEHLEQTISGICDRIKRAYSADLFLMLDQMEDKTMTAREVLERTQEKMTVLGPVVQRLQFEFLGRIIERVYNILDREGVLPVPDDPDLQQVLTSEEVRIEYISPMAQAQKMSGLVNIEQATAFVAQTAQLDQSVLDKVNWAEAVNRYFDLVGAPASIRRTDDEFAEIQAQKQEQAAQMQQLAQAQQVAQMAAPAAQAAKNMTEAAQDGNPALSQMMGMQDLGQGMGG